MVTTLQVFCCHCLSFAPATFQHWYSFIQHAELAGVHTGALAGSLFLEV